MEDVMKGLTMDIIELGFDDAHDMNEGYDSSTILKMSLEGYQRAWIYYSNLDATALYFTTNLRNDELRI